MFRFVTKLAYRVVKADEERRLERYRQKRHDRFSNYPEQILVFHENTAIRDAIVTIGRGSVWSTKCFRLRWFPREKNGAFVVISNIHGHSIPSSVFNNIENHVTAIVRELDLDPQHSIFVGHYPQKQLEEKLYEMYEYEYSYPNNDQDLKSYDTHIFRLVTFDWTKDANGAVAHSAVWTEVDRQFVEMFVPIEER